MNSDLTSRLPFREHIRNIRKVLSFALEMDRSYLWILGIVNMIKGCVPYVELLLSAYILDAIDTHMEYRKIMTVIICSLAGILALRFIASTVGSRLEVRRDYMSRLYSCSVETRILNMDFTRIDSPEVKRLKERIRKDNNWGNGINSVFGMTDSIMADFFNVFGAIVVGAPAAGYLIFSKSLTAWAVLAAVLAISAGALSMQIRCKKLSDVYQYKDYEDNADKEERFCWCWDFAFSEGGFDYKNGKDIRIYEGYELMERWSTEVLSHKGFRKWLIKGVRGDGWGRFFGGIAYSVLNGASYLIVAITALTGTLTTGGVILYAGCLGRLLTSLKGITDDFTYLALSARRQLSTLELIGLDDEMYKGKIPVEKRSDNAYQIEFRNVSFRYPGAEQYALKNFSLKLKIGEKLAIVGMNGSGKTTMIKLLCRLYDPQEGEILLNGVDIRKFRQDEYSELFSVVFQDYKLFPFRLAENVAVNRDYDAEHVRECLEDADFGERLSKLEKGADTYLYKNYDDDGIEISGGEAQKIAIARAIYKNAPFILLDEPTAALDPIAEYEIYTNFDRIVGSKTAIYISHRLSSCRFCGKIAVFHEGSLVQMGSHEELLADTDGKYCEMWNAQAQYYRDNGVLMEGIS